MNTAIARNHDQMIARPWQGRELGPFPAGWIKNFVRGHGDFVDAASTDARDHLVVVAANGRIHAIGGRLNTSSENVDQHDVYNPATNSWQAGLPLPTARSGIAGALYQGKIFVAGGECRDKKTFNEFEGYDVKSGRWSAFSPMPVGRHGFGGVVVGNSLYFAAGGIECGGGGRSNDLLVFNLP